MNPASSVPDDGPDRREVASAVDATVGFRNALLALALGAGLFTVLESVWWWRAERGASEWILEPRDGIAWVASVFAIVAAVLAALRPIPALLIELGGLWCGAVGATLPMLLLVGPGNIFPIVLVLDAAILGASVATGALFAWPLAWLVRRAIK